MDHAADACRFKRQTVASPTRVVLCSGGCAVRVLPPVPGDPNPAAGSPHPSAFHPRRCRPGRDQPPAREPVIVGSCPAPVTGCPDISGSRRDGPGFYSNSRRRPRNDNLARHARFRRRHHLVRDGRRRNRHRPLDYRAARKHTSCAPKKINALFHFICLLFCSDFIAGSVFDRLIASGAVSNSAAPETR